MSTWLLWCPGLFTAGKFFLASRPPKVGSKILDVYIALARFLGSFWAGAFYPSYLFAFQLFVLFVNFKGNFYSFHFLYSSFAFAF